MNYVSQRDVLTQFGISLSTLKRWKKNRGFPKHLSLSEAVLVYDVTTPDAPAFQQYIYLNDHVSPEAMAFVSSAKSPNGAPMLIVANEVSGTVAVLQPTH